MLAERHFHFHSVVAGRLQDPPAGSNYGKKVKVPFRRVRGGSGVCMVCVKGGSDMCVCGGGDSVSLGFGSMRT